MRLMHVILMLLLTILGLLVWIAFSPEPAAATGAVHPGIAGMRIGGDGLLRLAFIGPLAYLLQACVLVLVMLLITCGIQENRRTPVLWFILFTIGALYQFVWWNVWSRYQAFLHTRETGYFLGFPTATAWMMFGIWACGLGLLLLFVIGYRHYIFTEEDEAAFEKLEAEARVLQAENEGAH